MKRVLGITVISLVVLLALAYAVDYLVIRYRVAEKRNPFGTVTVHSYYAIEEKNRKTEYIFNGDQDVTCVHSLFPHLGYAPCWYLNQHTDQQIEM